MSRFRLRSAKRLNKSKRRLANLERLISSVYKDKVIGRIPKEVCLSLLEKYQDEKNALNAKLTALEVRAYDAEKRQADVDECPGKYSKTPREIHIY